jgi:hypothetical protein
MTTMAATSSAPAAMQAMIGPAVHPAFGPSATPAHQQAEPEAGGDEARDVEPPGRRMGLVGQEDRPEGECEHPDRDVHVEDPPPRHVGDEQAADDRPDRWRQGGRDDQDGRRARPLGRRERPEQHGQELPADGGEGHVDDRLVHHRDEHGPRVDRAHATF